MGPCYTNGTQGTTIWIHASSFKLPDAAHCCHLPACHILQENHWAGRWELAWPWHGSVTACLHIIPIFAKVALRGSLVLQGLTPLHHLLSERWFTPGQLWSELPHACRGKASSDLFSTLCNVIHFRRCHRWCKTCGILLHAHLATGRYSSVPSVHGCFLLRGFKLTGWCSVMSSYRLPCMKTISSSHT